VLNITERVLFEAWSWLAAYNARTRQAVREDDLEDVIDLDSDIGFRAVSGWEERIIEAIQGREVEVWIPLSLERRLKAAIHRMNGDILAAGWDEGEQFNVERDIGVALVSAANFGVRQWEADEGCKYDEWTGKPVEGRLLEELSDG
jgi:hypothetical protein